MSTISQPAPILQRLRGTIRPPVWAPRDVATVLRITLGLLAWKFLSLDYTILSQFRELPAPYTLNPGWLDATARWLQEHLLTSPEVIRTLQVSGALLLVGAAVTLRRELLAVGGGLCLVIYLAAERFVGPLYDLELCFIFAAAALLWPVAWRETFGSSSESGSSATWLGLTWAMYLAVAYWYAGWSKFRVSPTWFNDVHLEYLFPIMQTYHGIDFDPWGIASTAHEAMLRWPVIGQALALVTMVGELAWPLVFVGRWARVLLPGVMLATHVGIFLTSGILFLPLAVLEVVLWIPWRRLGRSDAIRSALATPPAGSRGEWPLFLPQPRWIAPWVAALAVVIPSWQNAAYGPFPDWNQFGFLYTLILKPATIYRLGYRDPHDGTIRPMPLNYCGFLDFRSFTGPDYGLRLWEAGGVHLTPEEALRLAEPYVRALRRGESNRWLLGRFACPSHLVSNSPPLDRRTFDELLLLEVEVHFDPASHQLHHNWRAIGTWPGEGVASVARLDQIERK